MAIHCVTGRRGPEISHLMDFIQGVNEPRSSNALIAGNLIKHWSEGKLEGHIYTDQWPQSSCVVMQLFEGNNPQSVCIWAVVGEELKICQILNEKILHWSRLNYFSAIPVKISSKIAELVHHQLGRDHGRVTPYATLQPYILKETQVTTQKRPLPKGFTIKQLQPCHVEVIGQWWPSWKDKPIQRDHHFIYSIINFDSIGVFTEDDPPQLVSWVVQNHNGVIHHLYTLEEYRGRGLASVVVREMCRKIQDKGSVPFCFIKLGNSTSVQFFKHLGFQETGGEIQMMRTYISEN